MNQYKYVLFDVDGVLARATNSADEILMENSVTLEEFFRKWDTSEIVASFEAGNITAEEFAKLRSNELEMRIKPDTIIKILRERKSILYDGVEELLDKLSKSNYKLACLSNTNVLHWDSIIGKEIFDRFFCEKFLSFEIGYIKPKKEIFMVVLNTLQCQANEVLYFDDSKKNIEAAISLGFDAVHVDDFDDLVVKMNHIL